MTPNSVLGVQSNTYTVPTGIDWVGFDEYNCWDTCYGNLSISDKVNVLLSAYPNKKIVLVGDGVMATGSYTESQLVDLSNKYLFQFI